MKEKSVKREILSWVLQISAAIVLGLLINHFVVQGTKVYSCSMQPTLYEGDRLWLDKVSPRIGAIHRGDIITFNSPHYKETLIKRVIAVEDDNVEIKEGKVYLNGEVLKEDYIKGAYTMDEGGQYLKVTVPKGHVYVLGDNRSTNIIDSRMIGTVETKCITGKAVVRSYPFNKIGTLD